MPYILKQREYLSALHYWTVAWWYIVGRRCRILMRAPAILLNQLILRQHVVVIILSSICNLVWEKFMLSSFIFPQKYVDGGRCIYDSCRVIYYVLDACSIECSFFFFVHLCSLLLEDNGRINVMMWHSYSSFCTQLQQISIFGSNKSGGIMIQKKIFLQGVQNIGALAHSFHMEIQPFHMLLEESK